MNAHLDSLSYKLCQVNTRVGYIARRQARLSGFSASPSPSPETSTNEDSDDGVADDDEDEDASSSSDKEIATSQ